MTDCFRSYDHQEPFPLKQNLSLHSARLLRDGWDPSKDWQQATLQHKPEGSEALTGDINCSINLKQVTLNLKAFHGSERRKNMEKWAVTCAYNKGLRAQVLEKIPLNSVAKTSKTALQMWTFKSSSDQSPFQTAVLVKAIPDTTLIFSTWHNSLWLRSCMQEAACPQLKAHLPDYFG